jgi:hypothetical protein
MVLPHARRRPAERGEDLPDLLRDLAAAAAEEDRGASIATSVSRVLDSDLLRDRSPGGLTAALVALGEVNLPLGRLIEGHVNALQLIDRLGPGHRPGFLSVWGADGARPARAASGRLFGTKTYASGLGVVDRAVVSVRGEDGTRLALVRADDPARQDPGTWTMSGMRATVSGDFVLDGLEPEWLGGVDAYFEEPHFLGGVWRIAALQLGGALGLLGAVRDRLANLGRLEAEAQVARLAPLLGRGLAARGLVERAAEVAEGPEGARDPDRAVALSVMARLLTEDLAQDAIAAAERAVGLRHFEEASTSGRRARDLAVYCRQVARDALEQKAGRILLGRDARLSEVWHG